ncbi:MAG: PAS domain S-box protein [SAR202 cluster bacterium]|jgi:PAS domain S-box-containing protein|nr:PAS domain S-box protein [SAR202 cluster bacterium]MDP6514108.1 PAS domain S-box protein [SAR202 cluster bacterium]MDP6714049.1 PAS domain S-box protein [SAR202 cluster bacterium]
MNRPNVRRVSTTVKRGLFPTYPDFDIFLLLIIIGWSLVAVLGSVGAVAFGVSGGLALWATPTIMFFHLAIGLPISFGIRRVPIMMPRSENRGLVGSTVVYYGPFIVGGLIGPLTVNGTILAFYPGYYAGASSSTFILLAFGSVAGWLGASVLSSHLTKLRNHQQDYQQQLESRIQELETDLQKRHLAEQEAIRQNEERFRRIVELTGDMVYTADSRGYFTYANNALIRTTGIPFEEFIGQHFTAFIAPDWRRKVLTFYLSQLRQLIRETHMEFPIIVADGSEKWVQQTVTLLRENEEVTGFQAIVRDVTERRRLALELEQARDDLELRVEERTGELSEAYEALKQEIVERNQLEQQLVQIQKMESVGQLASGIAHDFNNLLSVVIGYAQLAMTQSASEGRVDTTYLQEMQKAGERGAQLTRQLLAFSRRQAIEPEVLNINDLVVNLDKMLRRLIGEHVDLILDATPDAGSVKVDPGQMEQVLINLAVNARDAMRGGGKMTVQTMNVTMGEEGTGLESALGSGEAVAIKVIDTGVGMTPEVASRVFDPFFTTKEVGQGTGLGLSVCYGIVKQNGGHISVDSELGKGTTFTIYMPRVQESSKVLQPVETPRDLFVGTETVLLVEDEPAVRRLTVRALTRQGYKVLEAVNGEDAIKLIENDTDDDIDLLLTDVVMPVMGGRELAEHFRSARPDGKVLYMSGYFDDMAKGGGIQEPEGGFMQKPVTMIEMSLKVRALLDSE